METFGKWSGGGNQVSYNNDIVFYDKDQFFVYFFNIDMTTQSLICIIIINETLGMLCFIRYM